MEKITFATEEQPRALTTFVPVLERGDNLEIHVPRMMSVDEFARQAGGEQVVLFSENFFFNQSSKPGGFSVAALNELYQSFKYKLGQSIFGASKHSSGIAHLKPYQNNFDDTKLEELHSEANLQQFFADFKAGAGVFAKDSGFLEIS